MHGARPLKKQRQNIDPWAQGHSIELLRQIADQIIARVGGYKIFPVNAGGVAAEWVIADGVPNTAPAALYFHGGAYLCGNPAQYRNATVGLSRVASVRVLSVDYRLAPEHPHPAAFDDALVAYRWILQQPGIQASGLLVAGDSAGASIAVSVVMDALAHKLPAPACLVLNSPFAVLALASPSLRDAARNVAQPNRETIEWLARTYLQAGKRPVGATDTQHSPIYRNLTGLPPLLVQTAGLDNLQHDGLRLAAQALLHEVEVQYTEYPSAGHIWIVTQLPEENPAAADAFAEIGAFAGRYLRG